MKKTTMSAGSSIDKENICERIQISDEIKARAIQLALEVVDAMPTKYKKACMAGALYAACLEARQPIGLKDIQAVANGPTRKEIFQAEDFISKNMGLELQLANGKAYLGRFCSALRMGTEDKEAAEKAFSNFEGIEHGHSERVRAASIAHFIHRIATDQSIEETGIDSFLEIASVANLEPFTIKDFYVGKILPRYMLILATLPERYIHSVYQHSSDISCTEPKDTSAQLQEDPTASWNKRFIQ